MFGINKGFIGALIGLFFFSIIVFFVIYLLVPEVSLRFFGISVNSDEYVESSLSEAVASLGMPEDIENEVLAFVTSPEGSEFLFSAEEAVGGAAAGAISFISSDRFLSFLEDAGEFAAAGAGSVADFFSEHGSELVDGVAE